ncbi:MAG TPA: hypothetical protein VFW40_02720 [Capsulimonadaceae bacterium]|nr:hypothetical protein [Capsulimonadaceae bacterium]
MDKKERRRKGSGVCLLRASFRAISGGGPFAGLSAVFTVFNCGGFGIIFSHTLRHGRNFVILSTAKDVHPQADPSLCSG